MGKFIIMKGQSAAKLENQRKMDERLIGNTFNKIKVISFSHAKNSRKFYNVLCLRCNSTSKMRSDRFTGTQKLETCKHCRQKYAAQKGANRKLPKKIKDSNVKYANYRSNAKNRNLDFSLTRDQFNLLLKDSCYYCNSTDNIGVDRKDNTKGYTIENAASCCTRCNMMKKTLSVEDYILHCKKVTEFQEGSTTISKESRDKCSETGSIQDG